MLAAKQERQASPLGRRLTQTVSSVDSLIARLQEAKDGNVPENTLADKIIGTLQGAKRQVLEAAPTIILDTLPGSVPDVIVPPVTEEKPETQTEFLILNPLDERVEDLPEVVIDREKRELTIDGKPFHVHGNVEWAVFSSILDSHEDGVLNEGLDKVILGVDGWTSASSIVSNLKSKLEQEPKGQKILVRIGETVNKRNYIQGRIREGIVENPQVSTVSPGPIREIHLQKGQTDRSGGILVTPPVLRVSPLIEGHQAPSISGSTILVERVSPPDLAPANGIVKESAMPGVLQTQPELSPVQVDGPAETEQLIDDPYRLNEEEISSFAKVLRLVYVANRGVSGLHRWGIVIDRDQALRIYEVTVRHKPPEILDYEVFKEIRNKLARLPKEYDQVLARNPRDLHVLFEPFENFKDTTTLRKALTDLFNEYKRMYRVKGESELEEEEDVKIPEGESMDIDDKSIPVDLSVV